MTPDAIANVTLVICVHLLKIAVSVELSRVPRAMPSLKGRQRFQMQTDGERGAGHASAIVFLFITQMGSFAKI